MWVGTFNLKAAWRFTWRNVVCCAPEGHRWSLHQKYQKKLWKRIIMSMITEETTLRLSRRSSKNHLVLFEIRCPRNSVDLSDVVLLLDPRKPWVIRLVPDFDRRGFLFHIPIRTGTDFLNLLKDLRSHMICAVSRLMLMKFPRG